MATVNGAQAQMQNQVHVPYATDLYGPTGAGAAGIAPLSASHAEMTPEQIIAYVAMRLGDIDDQFQAYRESFDRRSKIGDELKHMKASLAGVYVAGEGTSADNATAQLAADFGKNLDDIEAAYAAKPGSGDLEACDDFMGRMRDVQKQIAEGKAVPVQVYDQLNADIDQRLSGLSSESELQMMSMQQLMQSRSQVVSMCSNMLASLNESAKNILSKIG